MEDDVYNIKGARGILYKCGTGRMRDVYIYILYCLWDIYLGTNSNIYPLPHTSVTGCS